LEIFLPKKFFFTQRTALYDVNDQSSLWFSRKRHFTLKIGEHKAYNIDPGGPEKIMNKISLATH
jgi:hypothetical protein